MSDQTNGELKINRPTSASILQEFIEKFNQRFDQLDKQQKASNKQMEQLRQTLQATIPPPLEATELAEQLKEFKEQLDQIRQFTEQAEKTQRQATSQIQTTLETLKPPSVEDLLSNLIPKLEEVLASQVQQAVQTVFANQQTSLQELLEDVQTAVLAIQPEIVKKVETIISQLPIPSAAEISAALNGRLEALDSLSERQDELIQGQAELQQQQSDLAGTVTQLGETVGTLKGDVLAATQNQFNAFQTQVAQTIRAATAELIKQLEPVQAAQKAIEAAIERLNTVSTTLTSEFAALKSDLQGEVNALTEQQGEIRQTAKNLSSAMGKLDGQVQQIAQSVRALEGTAKALEAFAEKTLLPRLQGQLESALKELKSAQKGHQTQMDQTISGLNAEVRQLQQANQQLQGYLRLMTSSPPPQFSEAYDKAIDHINNFESHHDQKELDQALKELAFRDKSLMYSPKDYPPFAAAVENALAQIWYHKNGRRNKPPGTEHAAEAKSILEIYYNTRIPEGKDLREQIIINRNWIENGPVTSPGTPPLMTT